MQLPSIEAIPRKELSSITKSTTLIIARERRALILTWESGFQSEVSTDIVQNLQNSDPLVSHKLTI